jgi:hypothetical protein
MATEELGSEMRKEPAWQGREWSKAVKEIAE